MTMRSSSFSSEKVVVKPLAELLPEDFKQLIVGLTDSERAELISQNLCESIAALGELVVKCPSFVAMGSESPAMQYMPPTDPAVDGAGSLVQAVYWMCAAELYCDALTDSKKYAAIAEDANSVWLHWMPQYIYIYPAWLAPFIRSMGDTIARKIAGDSRFADDVPVYTHGLLHRSELSAGKRSFITELANSPTIGNQVGGFVGTQIAWVRWTANSAAIAISDAIAREFLGAGWGRDFGQDVTALEWLRPWLIDVDNAPTACMRIERHVLCCDMNAIAWWARFSGDSPAELYNFRDGNDQTLLHIAAGKGEVKIVRQLLHSCAGLPADARYEWLTVCNIYGCSAADIAEDRRFTKCKELIQAAITEATQTA